MTDYYVYDVFSDTPFGGNQLAVIPEATGLGETDLQRIAAEFNFSETSFVYPPRNPKNTARVRIFTPTNEIPFAGHPTIGTAIALSDMGGTNRMTLELGVGPIPCTVTCSTVKSATFTTTAPLELFSTIPVETIANCLSIPQDAVILKNHAPQSASIGRSFVMVELANLDILSQASPMMDTFGQARTQFGSPENRFSTYLYVKTPNGVQARMFSPLTGTLEDPATGSAAATLGAYLTSLTGQAQTLNIAQGIEMGRPSQIFVSTTMEHGRANSVTVRGSAVKTMQGKFTF